MNTGVFFYLFMQLITNDRTKRNINESSHHFWFDSLHLWLRRFQASRSSGNCESRWDHSSFYLLSPHIQWTVYFPLGFGSCFRCRKSEQNRIRSITRMKREETMLRQEWIELGVEIFFNFLKCSNRS